ncbi:hypothetical protein FGG08_002207 [Glutinoglossum americanum]|uniref:Coupling of ubiquitin conjugation to ER degradation protein 1 n=1 Tax=Glutinoglossum americanum TaxID=1670608 RepID=A0A9P8L1W7_9PEZI|nr:hypothetical protein FGG08_002207 [Glutinoglossum americanum]
MAEQTLNIPQLIVVAIVGFVVLRWFFSSPSSSSSNAPRPSAANSGRRIDPVQVEMLLQMFPQVGIREIMWDLQRNGGNPNATTERILSGRGLETPPISFQPHATETSANRQSTSSSNSASTIAAANAKSSQPDLITRYNLSSKLSAASQGDQSSTKNTSQTPSGKQAWSQNKAERAQLLQRRREEMILAARRKMEEKDRLAARNGISL